MSRSTIFPGWRVVVGSGFGIAFGSAIFASAAFSQLANAWGHSFGWSQPELTKAATIFLLLQTLTYPVFGWLLDRWGSRQVASASIVLFAVALLALSRIENSLTQLYAAFALIGLVSAGTNVVSYARAISLWFNRKRGLALGLAASSQAIGAVIVPLLTAAIIAGSGWSSAVLTYAAIQLVVCLPLVWSLVRNSPVPYGLRADGVQAAGAVTDQVLVGPTRGAIIRSPTFWKLAVCFMVMGLTAYAILINVVFILNQTAGLSPAEVAKVQSIAGAAVLLGRIGFGWLLDRLHGPWVGVILVVVSALGIAIYAGAPGIVIVGGLLLGCSIGGESDLMPYLASRYFGTRSLSSVFGWFLSLFFVGAAIGPVAFASIAAAQHSVAFPMYLLVALQIVPVLVFLTLGRYPSEAELAAAT
ncbi:MAG TPA: MFS transporter [Burkholderiaceae bacterium]